MLGTLGGVVKDGHGKPWAVTAGHVVKSFNDGQRVQYFPDAERALLGTYVAPVAISPGCDLAKIDAPATLLSSAPVGIPVLPVLWPENEITRLRDARVVFIGGQVGRVLGTVEEVAPRDGHPSVISVQLACSDLVPGDSGGPLYLEDGETLFWLGTLVSGGRSSQNGFSVGRFLHPARALTELGV